MIGAAGGGGGAGGSTGGGGGGAVNLGAAFFATFFLGAAFFTTFFLTTFLATFLAAFFGAAKNKGVAKPNRVSNNSLIRTSLKSNRLPHPCGDGVTFTIIRAHIADKTYREIEPGFRFCYRRAPPLRTIASKMLGQSITHIPRVFKTQFDTWATNFDCASHIRVRTIEDAPHFSQNRGGLRQNARGTWHRLRTS
ncbi:MAG: hypothetical protein FJ009_19210 [Chloroflexi bacterium]|nr:hypothetical protein [Chloroflexota bacterium]